MEQLECIMTIHIKILEHISLESNNGDSVVMIPFTGHATGDLFQGDILNGGVDTQIISQDKTRHTLSARYMIKGHDYLGQECMLYIENNGNIYEPSEKFIFRTYPKVTTNSQTLKFLEQQILVAEGKMAENGVTIYIYKVD